MSLSGIGPISCIPLTGPLSLLTPPHVIVQWTSATQMGGLQNGIGHDPESSLPSLLAHEEMCRETTVLGVQVCFEKAV